MIRKPAVRRLILSDFRSYATLDLAIDGRMIALAGDNGAGKTNVLEALSLLSPGRGLRRAEMADCARMGGRGGWSASVELSGGDFDVQLGVGVEPGEAQRKIRIDRAPAASARALADHVRVVWLTPMMDGLFTGPPGDRRRFLDRLVLAVDPGHGARVNAMDRALRGRNRLLEERAGERRWLDAAERELAELAVAVAAARREAVGRLAGMIEAERDEASPFPWAQIALEGEIEAMLAELPALEVEERYALLLRESRARDAAAGRTLMGPQASDLAVRHGPKGVAAQTASTGEQKALLTGLVLAQARLVAQMSGIAPLLLMDEVAAHFDPARRERLFCDLAALGAQVWMTGADPALFANLTDRASVFEVTPGRVARLGN